MTGMYVKPLSATCVMKRKKGKNSVEGKNLYRGSPVSGSREEAICNRDRTAGVDFEEKQPGFKS